MNDLINDVEKMLDELGMTTAAIQWKKLFVYAIS